MELSAMLAYQSIDKELAKLQSEVMKSPSAREYMTSKHALSVAQEQVLKQNRDAGELIKQMESLIAEYEALEKELKESEEAVPEVADVTGADFFDRNVQKILQQLKNLSSEIAKVSSKIVELNQAHAASMAAGKSAKQKYTAVKGAYEAEVEKLRPAAEELKKKLLEAEKSCSKEFLDSYQRLKKSKVFPVIVPLSGSSCGGCFMELEGDALAALENSPFVFCPSCGRMLYKA